MTTPVYPPGPSLVQLIGRLVANRWDPLHLLQHLAHEYGDIAHFQIGPRHLYLLNHPDYIKDVLATHGRNFAKIRGAGIQRLMGEGILGREGPAHQRQRRVIQPAFHGPSLENLDSIITSSAAQTREHWRDGTVLDIGQEMRRLVHAIICEVLFGPDAHDEELDALSDAWNDTMSYLSISRNFKMRFVPLEKVPLPANRRFRNAVNRLTAFVDRQISLRRSNSRDRDDLLSQLLRQQETGGNGHAIQDQEIRDEMLALLAAGHETTANALTWTWYLLAQYPNIVTTLEAELDSVLAGRLPTRADIERLPYTERIFTEAMRLYPPVWLVTRQALSDYEVGGYKIPTNSLIFMSQYVIHRDPRYFPDPLRFDPQRWTAQAKASRPQFVYFPFAAGYRSCVGESFAWMEGVLIIATLAQQWRMQLIPGQPAVIPQPCLTLRPRHSIRMKLERRESVSPA